MPWRRNPKHWLRYWEGGSPSRTKADGFKTVLVYCVGRERPQSYHRGRPSQRQPEMIGTISQRICAARNAERSATLIPA
jgi:hypothetical protein